ncbi:unnamed protein product [Cuscuta epithymum]|uniref:Uncharacterized protein n=1 Tax=Cuscuta epithymum TaxID=186058 RepID=A0AAV0ENF2_9ASTE|nr:unnamed protein product [Cuscuta epithymum]
MLGCLPALEKVIINWPGYTIDDNQKHEIMEEVLLSPRASIKAKIVY